MGKSIYVSISCLGIDTELIDTVKNCYLTAENPNDIYFGIVCTGDEPFFEKIQNELKNIKNIKYGYYPVEGNLGIGIGRNLAALFYNDEDYFLQIDPHSRFIKKWDSYLIEKFNLAQKIVNNQKTVLSGYCGAYFYTDKNKKNIDVQLNLGYNQWTPNKYWVNGVIPSWTDVEVDDLPPYLKKMIDETGFAPAPKIVAMFMFGNSYLAKNLCLYEDVLFWEEELLQSMELINNGFTLVYPGRISPFYHFYENLSDGVSGYRDRKERFLPSDNHKKIYRKAMQDNYMKHVKNKNNYEKVKKFEKYNSITMIGGAKTKNAFPTKYENIGFIPVTEPT
jgi:hypothetical protein